MRVGGTAHRLCAMRLLAVGSSLTLVTGCIVGGAGAPCESDHDCGGTRRCVVGIGAGLFVEDNRCAEPCSAERRSADLCIVISTVDDGSPFLAEPVGGRGYGAPCEFDLQCAPYAPGIGTSCGLEYRVPVCVSDGPRVLPAVCPDGSPLRNVAFCGPFCDPAAPERVCAADAVCKIDYCINAELAALCSSAPDCGLGEICDRSTDPDRCLTQVEYANEYGSACSMRAEYPACPTGTSCAYDLEGPICIDWGL